MAGGDLDGDLHWVSFWEPLVRLVQKTQPYVDKYDTSYWDDSIEQELKLLDAKKATSIVAKDVDGKANEYYKYVRDQRAVHVRGTLAALAERAVFKALVRRCPLQDYTFERACVCVRVRVCVCVRVCCCCYCCLLLTR